MSAPIVTRGLAVGFEGQAVVTDIDETVAAGGTLALIGTNGSGKTTLLNTLAGLLPPVAGDVLVAGGRPGSAPARVAYLRQLHAREFILPLRARDVVAMARYPRLGPLRRAGAADRSAVDRAIDRMHVGDLADRPLSELSGGQRQRVYLAQALAWEADVLLLDEPTSGLDPSARGLLTRALAEESARGVATVVATHDVGDAMRADRVLVLAGRVVAAGPPQRALRREALMEAFGLGVVEREDGSIVAVDPAHGHDH